MLYCIGHFEEVRRLNTGLEYWTQHTMCVKSNKFLKKTKVILAVAVTWSCLSCLLSKQGMLMFEWNQVETRTLTLQICMDIMYFISKPGIHSNTEKSEGMNSSIFPLYTTLTVEHVHPARLLECSNTGCS